MQRCLLPPYVRDIRNGAIKVGSREFSFGFTCVSLRQHERVGARRKGKGDSRFQWYVRDRTPTCFRSVPLCVV